MKNDIYNSIKNIDRLAITSNGSFAKQMIMYDYARYLAETHDVLYISYETNDRDSIIGLPKLTMLSRAFRLL